MFICAKQTFVVVISNFRGCNSFLTNPYQGEEERAMTKLRVNYDI